MPKISVIMCVYNTSQDYLNTSINSILNQTFSDFEFIIYNDGSEKNCTEILRSMAKLDERIVYVESKNNHGLAYGLNECIKIAKGEFIARMDADDYCDLKRFEVQLKELNDKKLDLIGSNIKLFDSDGVWGEETFYSILNKNSFLFNSPMCHPTILGTNKIFNELYCDKKYCYRCEDYDFFMKIFAKGYKIGNSSEYLYFFREDDDAISRRKFRYRINEMCVRFIGFKRLHILLPKGIFYCFKPIIVGLMPKKMYKSLKRKRTKKYTN